MATLDSFLNFAIPAGIFIFLGVIIYQKAKKPIDSFFRMVKGWFVQNEGGDSGGLDVPEAKSYKIDYQGGEY